MKPVTKSREGVPYLRNQRTGQIMKQGTRPTTKRRKPLYTSIVFALRRGM